MPPFFSSSAFGGISIEWRSHRAAWPASNGFSLSSCAHHPIEISEILLFPWKNTNTLTPFPNCEHLKKTSHTQLSNPKKGELKNIYKRFLVDLSQLIAGKVLTFLTSHRQVVTWTKGEKGRLKKLDKWRFSKWDDKNESFTSPWLKILSVPKMEVNVVMNWSLYSWGIELISFRYSAPASIPPGTKSTASTDFTHLLLISEILHLRFRKAVTNGINSSTHSVEGVCYIPNPLSNSQFSST